MDFNDTPEEAAFRKEVRAWLDANASRKSDDKRSFRARNDDPELLRKAKAWQDKKAKAELNAQYSSIIEDGIANLNKALDIDKEYEDAMVYLSLLIREKADLLDNADDYKKQIEVADNPADTTTEPGFTDL